VQGKKRKETPVGDWDEDEDESSAKSLEKKVKLEE
jgi:hypothetical protein